MYRYPYPLVGYDPATCASGHCCLQCARLDAKPAAFEPHRDLVKTGEDSEPQGQRLYYVCNACRTTWTRFVKKQPFGRAYYWDARPFNPATLGPDVGADHAMSDYELRDR